MTKTAEVYFHEFRASADTDAAMSLLRSRDALLYLALMAAHLGEGQIIDGRSLTATIEPRSSAWSQRRVDVPLP